MTHSFKAGGVKLGGGAPLALIAGPCVIESEKLALSVAKKLKRICESLKMPLIFKSSYDKANRSSGSSYRGPGLEEGLRALRRVKAETGLAILSDVHCREEVKAAAAVLDIIQIPAFLCRQTDLVHAVADTGKVVNVKKGQFLSPRQMANVIAKIESRGNRKILLTERGVSFGYGDLVVDMRSLVVMREFGYPVVFDATHSVQLPGGMGTASGGERQYVAPLSRAAVAVGIDALFIETHPDPDRALCDGPNSFPLRTLPELLKSVIAIHRALNKSK